MMAYFAYVSLQDDDKILVFTVDADTGRLTQNAAVPVSGGPAALAMDPDRKFLYAGRRGAMDIASFSVDQANGGLTQIGSAPLQGEPVALATDRKGRYATARRTGSPGHRPERQVRTFRLLLPADGRGTPHRKRRCCHSRR
jgi:6-phosphogluconolactonase (cycloisomerase 2 family)